MKFGFVKTRAVSPALKVGDVDFNRRAIAEEIGKAEDAGVEILVFPELCLTGYTCGDLFLQPTLTDACLAALQYLAAKTHRILVFVGVPVAFRGKLYNCAAALSNGKIVGVVPKTYLPNYGEFYEQRHFSPAPDGNFTLSIAENVFAPFSKNILFRDVSHSEIAVACEICEDLWVANAPSVRHAQAGASIIVNLSASNETVGKREYRKTIVAAQSGKNTCAYVYADAGTDESTSDMVFAGNHMIYENGVLLAEAEPFSKKACEAEIDVEFLLNERRRLDTFVSGSQDGYFDEVCAFIGDGRLLQRKISQTPFVPEEEGELGERAQLILNMQAHALAKRLKHTGAKTAVIGISGGLDSTLALLVTARAFDLAGKDRKDIIAVTMPGFGTTLKTKNNSLSLMNATGVIVQTVNISGTVLKHFKDIGHDPEDRNTTYENAQARYRTMILMDVANETGGLVIGTGDLSELALGWCTYNGDHMSMYAVNSGVPKTLVKHLVRCEAVRLGGRMEVVLKSVLNTEISPELLPPEEDGSISQRTEDIVGPYELHDFYLYHFARRAFSPAKILYLAEYAFGEKYDRETLKKWLVNFYKRFFAQQFKRNCVPDGVKVGSVSLSPRADWRMPSDASVELWLKEAEHL